MGMCRQMCTVHTRSPGYHDHTPHGRLLRQAQQETVTEDGASVDAKLHEPCTDRLQACIHDKWNEYTTADVKGLGSQNEVRAVHRTF